MAQGLSPLIPINLMTHQSELQLEQQPEQQSAGRLSATNGSGMARAIVAAGLLPSLIVMVSMMGGCSKQTTLDKLEQEQVLHVVTRNQPPSYYEDRDGPAGLEYDLAKMLAEELDVQLRLRFVESPEESRNIIQNGFAHFAMAGFGVTDQQQQRFKFGPTYLEVNPTFLYRKGTLRPRKPADLKQMEIHVIAHSHNEETCRALATDADFQCITHTDKDSSDLMNMIEESEIGFALIDSNELIIYQALFPHAKAAFTLDKKTDIAWLFPKSEDDSLTQYVDAFFLRLKNEGKLKQLYDHYYGHVQKMNYVGARTFIQHIDSRLPKYRSDFQEAAQGLTLDWRLLAAIAYQESHWNPKAKSPTGVRGLMMLTQATAKEMGVKNRLNPQQSIQGGSRYFAKVHKRIPDRIAEPDRTWFALAAYNVGYGHLEDARILTQRGGKDPDKWNDVKEFLPLLAKKKWYSTTRHGFARGSEPVKYVQNIRRYYDVLVWMETTSGDKVLAENEALSPNGEPSRPKLEAKLPISEIPPTL